MSALGRPHVARSSPWLRRISVSCPHDKWHLTKTGCRDRATLQASSRLADLFALQTCIGVVNEKHTIDVGKQLPEAFRCPIDLARLRDRFGSIARVNGHHELADFFSASSSFSRCPFRIRAKRVHDSTDIGFVVRIAHIDLVLPVLSRERLGRRHPPGQVLSAPGNEGNRAMARWRTQRCTQPGIPSRSDPAETPGAGRPTAAGRACRLRA